MSLNTPGVVCSILYSCVLPSTVSGLLKARRNTFTFLQASSLRTLKVCWPLPLPMIKVTNLSVEEGDAGMFALISRLGFVNDGC
jgi:hypothetical protein